MASAVAIISASAARAFVITCGMSAENAQRKHRGEAVVYVEEDFLRVIDRKGLGPNYLMNFINNQFS